MKVVENLYWGIDLGGTKIECIVLDDANNCIIRQRIATEAHLGYDHLISRIKLLIDQVAAEISASPKNIGFSTPGSLNPKTGLMRFCNTTALNNMPLKQSLETTFKVPCIIANDANLFAYAEVHLGAVKQDFPEAKTVFGIIMGTGVGAGIVAHQQILNGPNQLTGEWGHNILHKNGPDCYCGKKGCVEQYISGISVQNYYTELTGKKLTLQEIVKYADNNQADAQQTLQNLYYNFGLALSRVINILDPDVIVIGGGVGNIPYLYTEGRKAIMHELFSETLNTAIIPPLLGDSAGVYGAAILSKNSRQA
jgi:fructokinase